MEKTEWFETYMLEKVMKKCAKLYHCAWEELIDVCDVVDDIANGDFFVKIGRNNCKYLVCKGFDDDYWAIPWDFDGDIVEPNDCKKLFGF